MRIPALLISPWIDQGVVSTHFDHTSLLRYLCAKWNLDPLSARVSNANSIASVIRTKGTPRTDTPREVPVPTLVMALRAEELPIGAAEDSTPEELAEPENDLQKSLIAFAEHLEAEETPRSMAPQRMMAAGPLAEGELAKRRVESFLDYQTELAIRE